ncbi:RNA polymerase sigma factor RpoH [Pseudocolwellia agarivorans]|uniref:RNA polymerase sigma factor RpoH n=1 Tax=Pseudocolwellia agarivorans TaxID=1911682 RepID=UPI0009853B14|nr:RNA polymerase sigma factor RpoH [Pseudocolwellia agarivorans]
MSIQLPISLANTGCFQSYLTHVNSIPALNEEQEKTLFSNYQENNDLAAAQQIIMSHLRFVAYIAKGYQGYGLPIEDLVQEGTIGLMKSVKKFSLDFGVRLASFAVHYIKAEIQEYVLRNWRLVKSATTKAKRKLFYNLRSLKAKTEWLSYKEKKEIADHLGVSEADVNDMEVQLSQPDVFIDASADNDEEGSSSTLGHLLEDKSEPFSNKLINEDFTKKSLEKVKEVIDTLDDRSKDILINRWLSDERQTHKSLADKYGISHERIRQLEERAINNIRKKMAIFAA